MTFFCEEDVVFFRLVKYLDKNRTSISRVILNGPFSPMKFDKPAVPVINLQRNKRKGLNSRSSPVIVIGLSRKANCQEDVERGSGHFANRSMASCRSGGGKAGRHGNIV